MNWTTDDKPRAKRLQRRSVSTQTPQDPAKELERLVTIVTSALVPFPEARQAVLDRLYQSKLERERGQ